MNPTTDPRTPSPNPGPRRARGVRRAGVVPFARGLTGAAGWLAVGACVHGVRYEPITSVPPPLDETSAVVYLVGDAGDDTPGRAAVLEHLRGEIGRHEAEYPGAPAAVVFLGDNIYEVGAREAFLEVDLAHLAAQADVVRDASAARAVFLPGNHDWAKGADDAHALEAVSTQAGWVRERIGGDRAAFLPDDGCAGPAVMDLGPAARLVFLDTEWLLRRPSTGACPATGEVLRALTRVLAESADRRVVIAAHHPMATGGPHGGNVGAFAHGPFVYYLAVKAGLGIQDLASGRYAEMLEGLRGAIRESGVRPLAFAAGHDHSLQVIGLTGDQPAFQLVSGSGSRIEPVDAVQGTRYAASEHGYMRLEFGETTRLTVFGQEGDGPVRALFACALSAEDDSSCAPARRVDG